MNMTDMRWFPKKIDTGLWDAGHIQGIAVDKKNGYIYYSYTTIFVKAKLDGSVVGYVEGLTGHLGCIAFNEEDGKVYGSIEYKHDNIGQSIMRRTGQTIAGEDAFYIAIFDVDKIDRLGMSAETDDVMQAVYLPDVVDDYNAVGENGKPHRFACSGIDGVSFGPVFGEAKDATKQLMVAYGIYGDLERNDNDYQIIRQYDWREFAAVAKPLNQACPHHSGVNSQECYALFTGNTTFGVQNLEYDSYTGDWYFTVYKGKKPEYPNYPMYVIDGARKPQEQVLQGFEDEKRMKCIFLKETVLKHPYTGVCGNSLPYGQTGLFSFGNGYFYISHNQAVLLNGGARKLQTGIVYLYKVKEDAPMGFALVE